MYINNQPTFKRSSNVLDIIFCNNPTLFVDLKLIKNNELLSDHCPLELYLTSKQNKNNIHTNINNNNENIFLWNIKTANWKLYEKIIIVEINKNKNHFDKIIDQYKLIDDNIDFNNTKHMHDIDKKTIKSIHINNIENLNDIIINIILNSASKSIKK